ncbi:conserved exported hypothetical protein [Candidatus Desulfosporosinus infrequens]|uniref:NlpC/P60 domain-containing protein n=1 Tax=Candidatus Desulfosporosinus infrequens TaxID=2043169 RepID=A0A2U3L150_9FIRM|nr:conserved exported hypothetical protein [Candidatus Desulfosporosinus infrequens]
MKYLFIPVLATVMLLLATPSAQATTLPVKTVQTELTQLGYNTGPVEGIFGSETLAAVKAFQTTEGLPVDGIVGPQSSQALGILTTAKSFTGVPYVWGGTTPAGFDCSGFTQYVFRVNGVALPRTSQEQYQVGTPVSFNDLRPGDLVFFTFLANHQASHVGIYLGNNQFISATTHKGVTTYPFTPYWNNAYVGAKRV